MQIRMGRYSSGLLLLKSKIITSSSTNRENSQWIDPFEYYKILKFQAVNTEKRVHNHRGKWCDSFAGRKKKEKKRRRLEMYRPHLFCGLPTISSSACVVTFLAHMHVHIVTWYRVPTDRQKGKTRAVPRVTATRWWVMFRITMRATSMEARRDSVF